MTSARGLVFVHVPKTAGTTLRTIIDRQYPRRAIFWSDGPADVARLRALPEDERRQLLVVQGHVMYGIHEHLFVPVDYITMLRDPVELVTSMFYFTLRKYPRAMTRWTKNLSLAEFAAHPIYLMRNLQTRAISGMKTNDRAALDAAKTNLATRIRAFGLSDRFDESLMLFTRILGWRNVFYHAMNVSRRPGRDALPGEAVAVMREHNGLDLELYAFARQLFEERVAEQGASLQGEVQAFRRWNPVRGRLNHTYRRIRWGIPRRVRRLFRPGAR